MIKKVWRGKTSYTIYRSDPFTCKVERREAAGKILTVFLPDELLVAYVAEMVRSKLCDKSDAELVGLPSKGE
jgi:hypothetical protein